MMNTKEVILVGGIRQGLFTSWGGVAWGSGGLCTLIKHCKKNGYGGMGMKHLIYCGGLCPHYRSFNLIIFLITDYWFDLFFFFSIFFDLI